MRLAYIRAFLIGLFLVALTLAIYGQAIGYPFLVYDDSLLFRFEAIRHWSSIPGMFTTDIWENASGQGSFYRPLAMAMSVVRYKIGGFDPRWWHGSAVLLQCVAVLLFWRAAFRLTRSESIGLGAAMLYAVHPMLVESVAWISGICELLLAIFFFAGLLCYLRWREKPTAARIWLCAVFALAGLFSKETAIVLPCLVALHLWMFPTTESNGMRDRIRLVVRSLWPVAAAVAIYAGMRVLALRNVDSLVGNNPAYVVMTWPHLIWLSFAQMVWPVRMGLFHDVQLVTSLKSPQFLFPMLFVVVGAGVAYWASRREKLLGFLAAWWILALSPALAGVFGFTSQGLFHDRFGNLSLAALAIALAWVLSCRSWGTFFEMPVTPLIAALVLSVPLAILSGAQVRTWVSDMALFRQAVLVAPNDIRARSMYANQLIKAGQVQMALDEFRETAEMAPNSWEANFAYGVTLAGTGDLNSGEQWLRRAVQIDPTIAATYIALAEVLRAEGQTPAAISVLQQGLTRTQEREPLQEKLRELLSTPMPVLPRQTK